MKLGNGFYFNLYEEIQFVIIKLRDEYKLNHDKLLWLKVNSLTADNTSKKMKYLVRDTCGSAILVFVASLLFFKVGNLISDLIAIIGVILAIVLFIMCFRKLNYCDKILKNKVNQIVDKYQKKLN